MKQLINLYWFAINRTSIKLSNENNKNKSTKILIYERKFTNKKNEFVRKINNCS